MREEGRCVICGGAGETGSPCAREKCRAEGYHHIPAAYHELALQTVGGPPDPLIGQKMGDYIVVGPIGQGAFGSVFLCLQLPIEMPCAVKVLKVAEFRTDDLDILFEKFWGEGKALARLRHPNIVRLLQYGGFRNMPFIAMEYVANARTLRDEMSARLAVNRWFGLREMEHILVQTLNALEEAHQFGIVHRDIKPENIMLQRVAGDESFVKVLDFGVAKFLERGTVTLLQAGTPEYMAPEQIEKEGIGPPTDLYAVAVIAVELLTGVRPYRGMGIGEIFEKKLSPAYNLVDGFGVRLPEEFRPILRRALDYEPKRRCGSTQELRVELLQGFSLLERRMAGYGGGAAAESTIGVAAAAPAPADAAAGKQEGAWVDMKTEAAEPPAMAGAERTKLEAEIVDEQDAPAAAAPRARAGKKGYPYLFVGGVVAGALMLIVAVGAVAFGYLWKKKKEHEAAASPAAAVVEAAQEPATVATGPAAEQAPPPFGAGVKDITPKSPDRKPQPAGGTKPAAAPQPAPAASPAPTAAKPGKEETFTTPGGGKTEKGPPPPPPKKQKTQESDSGKTVTVVEVVKEPKEKKEEPPPPEKIDPSLPDEPNMADVKARLKGQTSDVRDCADDEKGIAIVEVVIDGPKGKAKSVKVAAGSLKGSKAAACIEKEVKGVGFAKVKKPEYTATYTYICY